MPPTPPSQPPVTPQATPPTGPRILLVEDDQMFGDILKKRFESNGASIVHVTSGKEAMDTVAKAQPFSIILLDVSLPDMDGFEILSRIRAVPAFANIPIIIVSNFVKEKDLEWGQKLGAVRFIQKSSVMPGEIVETTLAACK